MISQTYQFKNNQKIPNSKPWKINEHWNPTTGLEVGTNELPETPSKNRLNLEHFSFRRKGPNIAQFSTF